MQRERHDVEPRRVCGVVSGQQIRRVRIGKPTKSRAVRSPSRVSVTLRRRHRIEKLREDSIPDVHKIKVLIADGRSGEHLQPAAFHLAGWIRWKLKHSIILRRVKESL